MTKSERNRSGEKKTTSRVSTKEKGVGVRYVCVCGWRRRNKEVTGNCARGKTARRKRWKRSKTDATETSFTRSRDFADQTRQPVEVADCSASGTHRRRRSSCCRSASTLQPSFDARAPQNVLFCTAWLPAPLKRTFSRVHATANTSTRDV